MNAEAEAECIKWRGRILDGQYFHFCDDWDGLPIDETTIGEWPCYCYSFSDAWWGFCKSDHPWQQELPFDWV